MQYYFRTFQNKTPPPVLFLEQVLFLFAVQNLPILPLPGLTCKWAPLTKLWGGEKGGGEEIGVVPTGKDKTNIHVYFSKKNI